MSGSLPLPTIFVVEGDLLASLGMKQIRVLDQKRSTQVLEVSMESDESVRKAIKKIAVCLDEQGQIQMSRSLRTEIGIMYMCNVRHPHVMNMDFAVRCGDCVAICMSLCSRGPLATMLHDLTPDHVRLFIVQTACALRYLHRRRIIHGDIKPGNVFVDASNNAILGDFGHSRVLPSGTDTVKSWGGTIGYRGDEYYSTPPVELNAFLMDSYALGATMWALVFRRRVSNWDLLRAVETCSRMPDLERSVLVKLLQSDPQHRLTVQDILLLFRSDEKLREIIDRL